VKEAGAIIFGMTGMTAMALQSEPLSDVNALAIAASCGLFGGILASLRGSVPLTIRSVVVTIMASVGFSIALVYGWLIYPNEGTDFVLKFWPVVGVSTVSGLFAWVIFSKLMALIENLTLKEIRQGIVDYLTRGKP